MTLAEYVNISAVIIFFLCVILYAIRLRIGIKQPGTAKRGMLNIFYSLWVKRMTSPNETIVAVQTMRNLIMSVTFLSSTMLILLGLLVRIPAEGFEDILHLGIFAAESIGQLKLLLLISILIFSLILFLLSLRQMVRFSILIGIPIDEIETTGSKKLEGDASKKRPVQCTLDATTLRTEVFLKAMNRFTFGLRGVFYAVTILIWFVSVYPFIVAVILLTILLIQFHDIKTPCVEEHPI